MKTPQNSTLFLTLKKIWFDEILNGTKKIEFREDKHFWVARLMQGNSFKNYTAVKFQLGYQKGAPQMLVELTGIERYDCFYLFLGEILKRPENYTPAKSLNKTEKEQYYLEGSFQNGAHLANIDAELTALGY